MIKDLTKGKPASVLLRFSLPMFISVMFQQLYSIADSVIAGNFAGEAALSAVGVSYPITMIFMAIAIGCSVGCNVVISQLFGAKEYCELKTAVWTSIIASGVLSLLLTVVGLLITNPLLNLVKTPKDIFSDASIYLSIYIGGFVFLFFYNICTGIFQAMGDSKTPLYFLIGSSVGNILVAILFVAVFHMGVAGVAWATFLAQGISCILSFIALMHRINAIKTNSPYSCFSVTMLKKIGIIAIPSVLQQSFVSIGDLIIQTLINSFGSAVIAGYSSAIKLNTFALNSFYTFAAGFSGYTAQNIGANKPDRIKSGYKYATIFTVGSCLIFSVLFSFFGNELIHLFLKNGTELAYQTGYSFLWIVAPFYFTVAFKFTADAVLCGAGCMKLYMITTFTDLILRVCLAFLFANIIGANGIWLAWPVGWAISGALSTIFYKAGSWKKALRPYEGLTINDNVVTEN